MNLLRSFSREKSFYWLREGKIKREKHIRRRPREQNRQNVKMKISDVTIASNEL